jgi:chemotaxis protein MotA
MDFASIGGLIAGIVVIVTVMVLDGGSPLELFAHPAAILLVVGGSLAATTIASPLKAIMLLPRLIMIAMLGIKFESAEAIESLAKMADKARREGLLALEDESRKIKDKFLQTGIMLVVDGVDPAQVRTILEINIEHTKERHKQGIAIFAQAGGFAPTFGIIGTVMGLISVLKQLDNPNQLAKSIASAFLATLWGLVTANLIYLPLAAKLKSKSEEEITYRYMIMEGILALQAGENPRIVREKLLSFLPPTEREKKGEGAKGDERSAQPGTQKAKAES